MAVKITVKGHEEDYELLVNSIRSVKVIGKELIEGFDAQNIIMFAIPVEHVRYIQAVDVEEVTQSIQGNRRVNIYVKGDKNQDLLITGVAHETLRFLPDSDYLMINVYNLNGGERILDFSLPFENVRYIDFNIPSEEVVPESTQPPASPERRPNVKIKQQPRQ